MIGESGKAPSVGDLRSSVGCVLIFCFESKHLPRRCAMSCVPNVMLPGHQGHRHGPAALPPALLNQHAIHLLARLRRQAGCLEASLGDGFRWQLSCIILIIR